MDSPAFFIDISPETDYDRVALLCNHFCAFGAEEERANEADYSDSLL